MTLTQAFHRITLWKLTSHNTVVLMCEVFVSLWWCHWRFQVVCPTAWPRQNKESIKSSDRWRLGHGAWVMHKGSIVQKAFPCHNAIMMCKFATSSWYYCVIIETTNNGFEWKMTEVVPRKIKINKSGGRLNKKDGLTRYGNSHVKDKTS